MTKEYVQQIRYTVNPRFIAVHLSLPRFIAGFPLERN